ncbi:hypothetical protein H2200_008716 [Cladophialophora chaetospira]|uniref:Uncharacterized protein n=1 Tax=Cladophialophora chaetospira TaxID=386627 RepID=A0AA38X4L8_9EURO|nr:hypothetical protein H2200_008716 [Cladophialophora chaetospira]
MPRVRQLRSPTGNEAMIKDSPDQSSLTRFPGAGQDSSKTTSNLVKRARLAVEEEASETTSILGKRDRRTAKLKDLLVHLNGKFFEVRPVIVNTVTTESFLIACEKAPTIPELLEAVQDVFPAIAITRIFNSNILPQKVLLMQETNSTNSHRRWDTIFSNNTLGYQRYLHRNLVNRQPQRPLKVEIHLVGDGITGDYNNIQLEQMLKNAGEGLETTINVPTYRQVAHLRIDKRNKYHWNAVPLEWIDTEELEACIEKEAPLFRRAPNTNTWMPNSKPKYPKKRKNGFFADKKAKKRRNREAREANANQGMASVQDREVDVFSEGKDDLEDEAKQVAERPRLAKGKESRASDSNNKDHVVDGAQQVKMDDEDSSLDREEEAAAGAKQGANDGNKDAVSGISFDEVAEAITGIAVKHDDDNEHAHVEDEMKELALRGKSSEEISGK